MLEQALKNQVGAARLRLGRNACSAFLIVDAQSVKNTDTAALKIMPKRWIVERSLAWLDKNRRPSKHCERVLNTSLQFVHLAFLALLLRRA